MDESKSKEVPVSKLVNVSDLSSSILGFWDAEFNWVTVPHQVLAEGCAVGSRGKTAG